MVSASDIPIDIAVSKMLDWLVDRRHCTNRWQKTAAQGQTAAEEAMKELDKDEVIKKCCKALGIKVSLVRK